jgi:hypothetical protein
VLKSKIEERLVFLRDDVLGDFAEPFLGRSAEL